MLHLCGYDHMEEQERIAMEKRQEEILRTGGFCQMMKRGVILALAAGLCLSAGCTRYEEVSVTAGVKETEETKGDSDYGRGRRQRGTGNFCVSRRTADPQLSYGEMTSYLQLHGGGLLRS